MIDYLLHELYTSITHLAGIPLPGVLVKIIPNMLKYIIYMT